MPLGAHRLGQRTVRDVSDERVLPLVLVGAGNGAVLVLAQQSARDQAAQRGRPVGDVAHLIEQGVPGHRTAHRRVLQKLLLFGGQRVEPRGDQQPDRLRAHRRKCPCRRRARIHPAHGWRRCRPASRPSLRGTARSRWRGPLAHPPPRSIRRLRAGSRASDRIESGSSPGSAVDGRRGTRTRDSPRISTGAGHGLRCASASMSTSARSAHCRSSSTTTTGPARARSSSTSRAARAASRSLRGTSSSSPTSARRSAARAAGCRPLPMRRAARSTAARAEDADGAGASSSASPMASASAESIGLTPNGTHRPTRNRSAGNE